MFGVGVNSNIIFEYADKYQMDRIETLELIKRIEREASSGQNTKNNS